jgi:hypothetical protein
LLPGCWPLFSILCRVEFHRFLMALSVLPGILVAIRAHLLPWRACSSMMALSSSSCQASFFIRFCRDFPSVLSRFSYLFSFLRSPPPL